MGNGVDDSTYTRLVERFERLMGDATGIISDRQTFQIKKCDNVAIVNEAVSSGITISAILDVWEKDGLDAAMDLFKRNIDNLRNNAGLKKEEYPFSQDVNEATVLKSDREIESLNDF